MSCLHVDHHGRLVEPSFVAPCQLRHSIGVLLYQVTLQLSTSASSLRPFYVYFYLGHLFSVKQHQYLGHYRVG